MRKLSEETFQRIVRLGGVDDVTREPVGKPPILLSFDEIVIPQGSKQLMAPQVTRVVGEKTATVRGRRTPHAKLIGDRAEEIALKWIANNFPDAKEIKWVSQDGFTPGWDIEFRDAFNAVIGVEVKGTSGAAFTSFDLTANELVAARLLGERYLVLLIAECLGKFPVVQVISNISTEIASGGYAIEPTAWRVTRASAANG